MLNSSRSGGLPAFKCNGSRSYDFDEVSVSLNAGLGLGTMSNSLGICSNNSNSNNNPLYRLLNTTKCSYYINNDLELLLVLIIMQGLLLLINGLCII